MEVSCLGSGVLEMKGVNVRILERNKRSGVNRGKMGERQHSEEFLRKKEDLGEVPKKDLNVYMNVVRPPDDKGRDLLYLYKES